MNKVTVIGSINVDIILEVVELVRPGETILAKNISKVGGGKGANQAVAAARLGANVSMIGMVGTDDLGVMMLDQFSQDGINTSAISKINQTTGTAYITVDSHAENSIVLVAGANHCITNDYIDQHKDLITASDFIIFQNEIPVSVTSYAIKLAKSLGKVTVFNNAPAQIMPAELFKYIDFLVVNETELETLTPNCNSHDESINQLLELGVGQIILTLGKKGSVYINVNQRIEVPAQEVAAVDTTAAGDTFIGAFFAQYHGNVKQALEFATRASAITVQRKGAQTSIPYLKELN